MQHILKLKGFRNTNNSCKKYSEISIAKIVLSSSENQFYRENHYRTQYRFEYCTSSYFTPVSRFFASHVVRRSLMTSRKARHFRAIVARNVLKIHTFLMNNWSFRNYHVFISCGIYDTYVFYIHSPNKLRNHCNNFRVDGGIYSKKRRENWIMHEAHDA